MVDPKRSLIKIKKRVGDQPLIEIMSEKTPSTTARLVRPDKKLLIQLTKADPRPIALTFEIRAAYQTRSKRCIGQ